MKKRTDFGKPPARSKIVRTFDRERASYVFQREPFLSPSVRGKPVDLCGDELDIVEGLWNGGSLVHGRVFQDGIYAHYFYWSEDPGYPHVYGRAALMLLARGVIIVRFDDADNAEYVLSKDAERWMDAMTRRKAAVRRRQS